MGSGPTGTRALYSVNGEERVDVEEWRRGGGKRRRGVVFYCLVFLGAPHAAAPTPDKERGAGGGARDQ